MREAESEHIYYCPVCDLWLPRERFPAHQPDPVIFCAVGHRAERCVRYKATVDRA